MLRRILEFFGLVKRDIFRPSTYYRHPDGDRADQPEAQDLGQHDIWKREMYLTLWRAERDLTGPALIDLHTVGLTPSRQISMYSALYPLTPDFCAAVRRIGGERLAQSTGRPGAVETWCRVEREHRAAAQAEAERRYAINQETAKKWNPANGAFVFDEVSDTLRLFSVDAEHDAERLRAHPLSILNLE